MSNKIIKLLTIGVVVTAMTGCASFNGKMVNANGALRDCSSSGGGIGLGAIVGLAMAYGSNQSCESSMEKQGFVLQKDVGIHGIELDSAFQKESVVLSVEPPADGCLARYDELVKVNEVENPRLSETQRELFGKYGKEINIVYKRGEIENQCEIVLLQAK